MTDLIGKAPINPFVFYSGKIAGYITWLVLFLSLPGINVIDRNITGWNDYPAYLFLVAGLTLSAVSLFHLGEATRLGLPSEDTELKTGGLYRFSRNPMYLGFDLLTLASVIYTFNIWIALLGAYSIITYHLIILGEERFLEGRFGEAYVQYKRNTKRYL